LIEQRTDGLLAIGIPDQFVTKLAVLEGLFEQVNVAALSFTSKMWTGLRSFSGSEGNTGLRLGEERRRATSDITPGI